MALDSLTSSALFDLAQTKKQSAEIKAKTEAIAGNQAARNAAEEFEAIFLATMFESMFSGIKTDGPFGGGHGEQVYRSMLNQEYAASIAKSGGVGIADDLFNEMIKTQEQSQKETS